MSPLPIIVLFILSISTGSRASADNASESFFKLCPPTRCANTDPIIRFPFRLNTQPAFCGREGFELSCSGDNTVLRLPFSGDYRVKQISYRSKRIFLTELHRTNCPIQSLLSFNLSGSIVQANSYVAVVKCTERVAENGILGPIDCLQDDDRLVYVTDGGDGMNKLPLQCSMLKNVVVGNTVGDWNDAEPPLERFLRTGEIVEGWLDFECYKCENSGLYCGFNSTRNGIICSSSKPKSFHVPVIIGTSVGGTILVALVVFFIYRHRKSDIEKETQLRIEKFLDVYKALNPTRYTFTDIKKITSRFKNRLGQGGYGSVYQGKLPSGLPVAVKMLENSKGYGEEFINEVATISRIHHFNVVRLLGFCYEGTRRALVYEFMPSGSLEKFLSSKEAKLSWEKLQQIAIGVARGIEYLHQGCNQRILHFDIKPHNILLDQNLQPKISDFGLAKLCSKDQSVVSMTAARGTSGYIAPELFSRNFGEVSYKSDVYSFGMLLLEMVGCRKNIDIAVENQSQIYFPEWIYERMNLGKELGLQVEMDGDEEIAKKLAIAALWCIQWTPAERPSMTRVVQMLEGDLKALEMPPKPFISPDVEMGSTWFH